MKKQNCITSTIAITAVSLLGAAACARLAASGGAVLIWWNYRDFNAIDQDDDADE